MNEMMVKCLFEFIGTAILVLFGDGVVASNVLKKSKGDGSWSRWPGVSQSCSASLSPDPIPAHTSIRR